MPESILLKHYSLLRTCLTSRLRKKETCLNVAFLDCCRSFRYVKQQKTRGDSRGLGEQLSEDIAGPMGTVIAHACAPNHTASDGAQANHGGSLFPILFSLVGYDDDQCHYINLHRAFYGTFVEAHHVAEYRSLRNDTASWHRCQGSLKWNAAAGLTC